MKFVMPLIRTDLRRFRSVHPPPAQPEGRFDADLFPGDRLPDRQAPMF